MIYGFLLSAIIGVIAGLFLILEGITSEAVWSSNNRLVEAVLVIIGSLILYLLLNRWPNLPKTSQDSLRELKLNKTIDYHDVFLNLLITLIILSFGAGVGPEAALLSAIISLSIWQADKVRYLYFEYDKLKKLPLHETLKRLFDPFKFQQKYVGATAPKIPSIIKQKRILYPVFIINGILAFTLLIRQTDQPSFIIKLGESNWHPVDIWILPILMIVGIIFGKSCKLFYKVFHMWINRMNLPLLLKVSMGAIAIILISYLAPDLLFSGQHSLNLLIGNWANKSPLFLMVMGILKLLFLAWCLNFNWRGGHIFPITFAAMIEGFAIAQLLPGYDQLFIVAIVATTIMSELISPVVAGIFIMLFFPLKLTPIIILVAILMYLKNKIGFKKTANS
ncbi:chloride channel protein [Companilactobacillus huachuanensis]|uniref:chloride channel protein n=1 Tax=Companilactobacillus huachuanensis TaxID=2559914 RepID=UPI001CC6F1E1|nr:chloride channel protein [Companilactobacillus huachuanensis]